jgi:hypothetical protein
MLRSVRNDRMEFEMTSVGNMGRLSPVCPSSPLVFLGFGVAMGFASGPRSARTNARR